ncbi:MAG: type II toxin-antitoxin system HicB family antitoxin [Rhizobiaceae bacterium]|nr:type II toxin-antitoxin system HicB family antitoxin [Rhizobiaceae bacterium]
MQYSYPGQFDRDPDGGYLVTFPDVPEALTQGDDLPDAKRSAAEALGLALRGYVAQGRRLPRPSAARKGFFMIHVETGDALKLAVIEAFQAAAITKSELARRLGKGETEVYRILNPDHPTKLAALEDVLRVLGKEIIVSVKDAA